MATLLRKLFILDYQNIDDSRVRSLHGVLASIIGLVLNAILVGLKMASALLLAAHGGWVFSMALIGDALNNLFDFSSCLISLVGFRIISRPADKEHPYGHGRAEYIAGMLIGVAILVSAGLLLYRSIASAVSAEEVRYDVFAFIALALTIPLKGFQAYLNFSFGKTLNSATLTSVGRDATIDVCLSSTLLLGAAISAIAKLPSLDAYLGMGASLFLGWAGVSALLDASGPLIGAPIDKDLEESVRDILLAHEDVRGIHDFLCHSYGEGRLYITVHVEMSGSLTLQQAHDIVDALEEEVALKTNAHVVIHPDPIEEDPDLPHHRDMLRACLDELDGTYIDHDVHYKDIAGIKTLCFELTVPFGADEGALLKRLEQAIDIPIHVTFEHPYV